VLTGGVPIQSAHVEYGPAADRALKALKALAVLAMYIDMLAIFPDGVSALRR
jgi:hypothetical protein